jgi:Acetyltransferases, including N-acetylases of ribosomal proteins
VISIDYNLLKGNFVYLEALQPEHYEILCKLAKDERIWEFTKTILINDTYEQQFRDYLNVPLNPVNSETIKGFVIRETNSNDIIGMTRFYDIDEKNKRVSIGYTWYLPRVWGKVHNKECKLLLLTYAFEHLDFNRVAFEVAHQNIRSQKAVEKIGGVKEGELRKYAIRPDGVIRNTVIFSIINDEWPSKKERLIKMIADSSINN